MNSPEKLQINSYKGRRPSGSSDTGGCCKTPANNYCKTVNTHKQQNNSEESNSYLLQNEITFTDPNSQIPITILFHLIDHLFQNVFVGLPETCIKSVLVELWRLVSHDIILDLNPMLDRWSKPGISEALLKMEQSANGFCVLVLSSLVNFTKEHFVIDITVNFIEKFYNDVAHVSKAAARILDTDTIDSNENKASHCTFTKESSCMINFPLAHMPHHKDAKTSQNSSVLNWKKQLFVTTLLSVTIIAVSLCGATVLCYQIINLQNNKETGSNHHLNISHATSLKTTTELYSISTKTLESTGSLLRYVFTVGSYGEYKDTLFKLMHDCEISLVVSLEKDDSWPLEFPSGDTHMVTEVKILVGPSIHKLFSVLYAMKNVINVTLIGTENFICNKLDTFYHNNINLPSVENFTLQDFKACYDFYKSLSETFILSKLKTFQISNGILTKQSTDAIKKFISNSRSYLKSIEISRCYLHAPLFERGTGTYQNVQFLRVDFQGDDHIIHVSNNIYNVFPNLKTFVSTTGFIVWDQFLNLAGCRSLEYVKIGLKIQGQASFNLLPLLHFFHSLKTFDLLLKFMEKNRDSGCKVIGLKEVDISLSNFTYRSNCRLQRSYK